MRQKSSEAFTRLCGYKGSTLIEEYKKVVQTFFQELRQKLWGLEFRRKEILSSNRIIRKLKLFRLENSKSKLCELLFVGQFSH